MVYTSIISWLKARKQGRTVFRQHLRVKSLYKDGTLDQNDIKDLNHLRDDVANDYSRGKISHQQYESLKNEISRLYREIYNKEINSLKNISDKNCSEVLDKIIKEITETYAKGQINELHYNLLKEKISDHRNNQDRDLENT